ncbi:hypothetical protein ACFWU5_03565 [Nocardia sp. NPDC058640]|uniref:hypothetical protein n=1 Tax=Nocardia sp. NPDC058640 TaxID=3346571 RepID=UPI0036478639
MSDPSAGQGYPSQDDGLTSYPENPAPAARIPQPPSLPPYPQQPYGQPYGQPQPYGSVPGAVGAQAPYGPQSQSPYPGPGVQPAPESGPRVVPQSVQIAFYVMLAGALVTLLSAAYSLTTLDEARSSALDASGGVFRGDELDFLVYATVGSAIGGALISAGLWVWMAFVCRAGKNWGRITGTVFFGINVVMYLFGVLGMALTSTANISLVFSTVNLAIGLAAVILLWNGKSKPYFAPPRPPGYQPYPGYPPTSPY